MSNAWLVGTTAAAFAVFCLLLDKTAPGARTGWWAQLVTALAAGFAVYFLLTAIGTAVHL